MPRLLTILFLILFPPLSTASLSVSDDLGETVTLAQPAQRIISLAPHATELLFAAGAGDRLVGVVKYSDFPPAAREIEQVGSYKSVDLERIVALKPDLVVAWPSGNKPAVVEQLKSLGLTVYQSQPQEIIDVPRSLRQLGVLTGHSDTANAAAVQFEKEYQRLRDAYSQKSKVTLFYQIWNRPIMTINGEHLISKVMQLCGGENVFAQLQANAPKLDVEAVLAANPQVIVASGMGEERPDWLEDWRKWDQLQAVKNNHLYFIPPDIIQRHSPRILQGAQQLCEALDKAR